MLVPYLCRNGVFGWSEDWRVLRDAGGISSNGKNKMCFSHEVFRLQQSNGGGGRTIGNKAADVVYSFSLCCDRKPNKGNRRKERLALATVGEYFHQGREVWCQEKQVASHVPPVVWKQSVIDAGVQPAVSFLFSPGALPSKQCHSHLEWVILPQLTQSRKLLVNMMELCPQDDSRSCQVDSQIMLNKDIPISFFCSQWISSEGS